MVLAALAAFIAPIYGLLITTGALIVTDFLTGIPAAIKRGEKIQSRKMGNTVTKLFLYTGAILLSQLMQNNILPDMPVTKMVSTIICGVEFKSVLENIKDITGLDIWTALKSKLNERKE